MTLKCPNENTEVSNNDTEMSNNNIKNVEYQHWSVE